MKRGIVFSAVCLAVILLAWTDLDLATSRQEQGDKQFIMKAAQSNIAEIAAGKMALSKATSADVKKFGQMMVDDHTRALKELDSIVRANKGPALPAEPDPAHKQAAKEMEALSGKSFDAAYISSQLKDHKEAIALFEKESSTGTDAAVKSYAIKTLPHLRMHLEHAQSIASTVSK